MNKPLSLILWILIIEIVVGIVFLSNNWIENLSHKEEILVESTLGVNTNNYAKNKAEAWHKSAIIDSGLYAELEYMLIPTEKEARNSRGLEKMGKGWFKWWGERIDSFSSYVYQVMYRTALLSVWLPYVLILFVPAIFDGVMSRKIKSTNFDYASPVLHRYGLRGSGFLLVGLGVSMFLPFSLNPMIVPIVFMTVCVLIGLSFGNMQKRI